jgi:hypothetical protein
VGATIQDKPPRADCYAFMFWDGLSSLYSNSNCGTATSAAGYATSAYANIDAGTAFRNGAHDAVYFSAGHSLDWGNSGIAALFELPNGGDLSALVGSPSYAPQISLTSVCNDKGNCHYQSATAGGSYAWGTAAELDEINLVVLEECNTANNSNATSIGQAAFNAGAGTVIGFTKLISFAVNSTNDNRWGYAWANKFWSDLQSGSTYYTSMIDASNYENSQSGGWYGYDGYYMFHGTGAPTTLAPATYWYLVGCYTCV